MAARKEYRGKWAGLTAETIAELMGCSTSTAKKYLYDLAAQIGVEAISKDIIGNLVHRFREKVEWAEIHRFATRREKLPPKPLKRAK